MHRKLFELSGRSFGGYDLNTDQSYINYYIIYLDSCDNLYYKDTTNIKNAYLYCEALLLNDSYEESNEVLNQIKLIDNDKIRIYKLRSRYYLYNNNFEKALIELKEILKINPEDQDIIFEISEIYRLEQKFEKALDWLNKVMEFDPENGLCHIKKAEIFESMVTKCQKGRSCIYDDGLVYEMAFEEYKYALIDDKYKMEAKRRMSNLKPYLLTNDEKKKNNYRKQIESDCYKFLK
jgi:tetratricopeptide (TPR) repeat protein